MKLNVFYVKVLREAEFSPLKNAPGSPSDCPETCKKHLTNLHRKFVEAAGGLLECNGKKLIKVI
jgi:UDP-N-acetylglucosamine/UDP-N-acetylgalactosamine diphosphorylase